MVYLVIVLFLIAAILIWHGVRIGELEDALETISEKIEQQDKNIESLCHDFDVLYDDCCDSFDEVFEDIRIIRNYVGMENTHQVSGNIKKAEIIAQKVLEGEKDFPF